MKNITVGGTRSYYTLLQVSFSGVSIAGSIRGASFLTVSSLSLPVFHFQPPIAVVGAGIGGSAVAHFLQQHFGPRVQIDVYEKGVVGGRLATISVNKQHYESGAASFHSLSLHMQNFVKQLGECCGDKSTVPGWTEPAGPFQVTPGSKSQKVTELHLPHFTDGAAGT